MSGDDVEIEYRFFIPDPTILPPLGRGSKITQCYLPKWKVELIDDDLFFDGRVLVSRLPDGVVTALTKLVEESKITPRIRLRDNRAFVTIKGEDVGYIRPEWEFEVMRDHVEDLVTSFRFPSIMKKRYEIPADDGLVWEIDFFEGDNHGLVLAELEVPTIDLRFNKPEWLGENVTEDGRFGNGSLAREPWCDWKEDFS